MGQLIGSRNPSFIQADKVFTHIKGISISVVERQVLAAERIIIEILKRDKVDKSVTV